MIKTILNNDRQEVNTVGRLCSKSFTCVSTYNPHNDSVR